MSHGKLTKQDTHLNMPSIGSLASIAGDDVFGHDLLVLGATTDPGGPAGGGPVVRDGDLR